MIVIKKKIWYLFRAMERAIVRKKYRESKSEKDMYDWEKEIDKKNGHVALLEDKNEEYP